MKIIDMMCAGLIMIGVITFCIFGYKSCARLDYNLKYKSEVEKTIEEKVKKEALK